jgi:hypothetical protein
MTASHLRPDLRSAFFPARFPTKILHAFSCIQSVLQCSSAPLIRSSQYLVRSKKLFPHAIGTARHGTQNPCLTNRARHTKSMPHKSSTARHGTLNPCLTNRARHGTAHKIHVSQIVHGTARHGTAHKIHASQIV